MRKSPATRVTRKRTKAAFTRLELLVCLGTIFAILLATLPGLANTRSRTQQAGCIDNLRQIGQAIQLWATEHDNMVPWRVPITESGTRGNNAKLGNAYREFVFLSNFLVTPKILACPGDDTRIRNAAHNWGSSASGGIQNSKYANNATSYALGLHPALSEPTSFLSSDRNLEVNPRAELCALTGINNALGISTKPIVGTAAWTNSIHGLSGNILMMDGRVSEFSTPEFRSYLRTLDAIAENGTALHLLIP